MKILVLGKNGYVSRCFQGYMNDKDGYKVEAISVRGESWKKMSFAEYDVVFNTTGLAHNDARKGSDEEFVALNVTLTEELAKKAKSDGVSLFIHMSSMIVYGDSECVGKFTPIKKNTLPRPENIYGKSKLMGEKVLQKLEDDTFHVALIRSSRVYGEKDTDSIQMLTRFAKKMPVFPNVKNSISMIYSDNLCELVRLIAENKSSGVFFPQQEDYICTSKLVKDIAVAAGHKLWCTKLFNPILLGPMKKVGIVSKVFGNEGFDRSLSDHFDGRYRVISYQESVNRLANKKED